MYSSRRCSTCKFCHAFRWIENREFQWKSCCTVWAETSVKYKEGTNYEDPVTMINGNPDNYGCEMYVQRQIRTKRKRATKDEMLRRQLHEKSHQRAAERERKEKENVEI